MSQNRDWFEREFRTMIVLGDSIAAGGNATSRERGWAHVLARQINECQRVPVQLINAGIGANVLSARSAGYPHSGKPAGDERLREHVLAYRTNGVLQRPDLLIVALCLNDARSGTPAADYGRYLGELVERVREELADNAPLIVVLGPYALRNFTPEDPVWGRADASVLQVYNETIAALCATERCLFVDVLRAMAGAPWLAHGDGIHLNDLGHRVVANAIFQTLAVSCSALAKEAIAVEKLAPFWRDDGRLQEMWRRNRRD